MESHPLCSSIMYEWVCVSGILGPVFDPTILKTYFAFLPFNLPFPLSDQMRVVWNLPHPERVSHYPNKIPIQIDCFNGLQGSRSLTKGFRCQHFPTGRGKGKGRGKGASCHVGSCFTTAEGDGRGEWPCFSIHMKSTGNDMMMSVWTTYLSHWMT